MSTSEKKLPTDDEVAQLAAVLTGQAGPGMTQIAAEAPVITATIVGDVGADGKRKASTASGTSGALNLERGDKEKEEGKGEENVDVDEYSANISSIMPVAHGSSPFFQIPQISLGNPLVSTTPVFPQEHLSGVPHEQAAHSHGPEMNEDIPLMITHTTASAEGMRKSTAKVERFIKVIPRVRGNGKRMSHQRGHRRSHSHQ